MKKSTNYLLCFLVFLFSACEFDSDKTNFIEVEKPNENAEIYVNLNDIEPGETIILYDYSTYFNFTIDAGGKAIKLVQVKYGTAEYFVYLDQNGRGQFSIDRYSLDNHESGTLSLEIITSSGTGSIADLMGFEGYMGKLEYKIKYIGELKDVMGIKHRKNEEGYFEIYWNDLKKQGVNVQEYRISERWASIPESTEDTFYVDKTFFMGYKSYSLELVLNNGNYNQLLYYEVSEPYNSEISVNQVDDNLVLTWEQPKYRCQYVIEWDDINGSHTSDVLPYETLDLNIPYNLFERLVSGYIYFVPMSYNKGDNLDMYRYNHFTYNNHDTEIGYFNYLTYNPIDNILYLDIHNIRVINMEDMSTVSTRENDNENFHLVTSSYVSSKTAFAGIERIFIFPNSSLVGPTVIQNKYDNKRALHFTSKDYLVLHSVSQIYDNTSDQYISQNILSVYDASGSFLYEFKTKKNTEAEYLTGNGDYIVLASKDGIEIYNLSDREATLVHQDNNYYTSAQRLPGNTENILLKEGDYFTIRRMSDFSLIAKSDAYTNIMVGNIDPVTKKLLLFTTNDSKTIYLLDIETLEKTYQKTFNNYHYDKFYLYNGILITGDGYYYNINNEIK